jgi:hypothetical protein
MIYYDTVRQVNKCYRKPVQPQIITLSNGRTAQVIDRCSSDPKLVNLLVHPHLKLLNGSTVRFIQLDQIDNIHGMQGNLFNLDDGPDANI